MEYYKISLPREKRKFCGYEERDFLMTPEPDIRLGWHILISTLDSPAPFTQHTQGLTCTLSQPFPLHRFL
jgi:hypothetical protein